MRRDPLTARQRELLTFIGAYKRQYECAPSLHEMAEHLEVEHVNAANDHLKALQKKGYVHILHDRHGKRMRRAIKVLP